MHTRSYLRDKYGEGYLSIIDNDLAISWRPLPIGEYINYESLLQNGEIHSSVLEDEIFQKCVTNKSILQNMDVLPAGTIPIVVQNIMEVSGPLSIQHFNDLLANCRVKAQEPLHHLVPLIIRAFPGYKPEDVYAMPFETFMFRLAQAESLLLQLGVIKEPIALLDPNEQSKRKRSVPSNIPGDLKAAWDRQYKADSALEKKPPESKKPKESSANPTKGTEFKSVTIDSTTSPIFKTGDPVIHKTLNKDRVETEQAMNSEDDDGTRAKMILEAQQLYEPLISKLPYYTKK